MLLQGLGSRVFGVQAFECTSCSGLQTPEASKPKTFEPWTLNPKLEVLDERASTLHFQLRQSSGQHSTAVPDARCLSCRPTPRPPGGPSTLRIECVNVQTFGSLGLKG